MVGTIGTVEDQAALCCAREDEKIGITCGGNLCIMLINGYERRHLCTTQRSRARRVLRKFCTRACLSNWKMALASIQIPVVYVWDRQKYQWRNTQTHDPPEYTVPTDWLVGQYYSTNIRPISGEPSIWTGCIFGYSAIVVFGFLNSLTHPSTCAQIKLC